MYAIEPLADDLWQITLPKPSIEHLPYARPNNVFVLTGDAPALINAGHPSQAEGLKGALATLGLRMQDIQRVLATSWQVDMIGGAMHFADADLFAFSPDMVQPRHYGRWLAQERALRLEFATLLDAFEPFEIALDWDALRATLEAYYPTSLQTLPIIPLMSGQSVALAQRTVEVVAAHGPDVGHIMLHDMEHNVLFSADIIQNGLPEQVYEVRQHLRALASADIIAPAQLYPNHGRAITRTRLRLKHARMFLENFIDNAPMAMHKDPTLTAFVYQDLGIVPTDLVRYTETLRTYQLLLDELGRSRLLDTVGDGLSRRYGVGLNDARSSIR
jgi:glyoxylase-like metal-dependent hydrolase (beta-lactamase superfamily II)